MRVHEAVAGPYLEWVRGAKEKAGRRVWDLIQGLDSRSADAILEAKGVIPFEESAPYLRWRSGKLAVEFVTVLYAHGEVVEVLEEEALEPAVDPRVLTASDGSPSDVILGDMSIFSQGPAEIANLRKYFRGLNETKMRNKR